MTFLLLLVRGLHLLLTKEFCKLLNKKFGLLVRNPMSRERNNATTKALQSLMWLKLQTMKLRMREQGLKNHGIACIQFVRSHQLPRLDSILNWAQRDLNPRPTAPQAAILSKLNYEPTYRYLATVNYKFYSIICYCISFLLSQHFLQSWPEIFQCGFGLYLKNFKLLPQIEQ